MKIVGKFEWFSLLNSYVFDRIVYFNWEKEKKKKEKKKNHKGYKKRSHKKAPLEKSFQVSKIKSSVEIACFV